MADPKMIIDSPVGPYSPPAEIEAWIRKLKEMPDSEDVQLAIEEANNNLKASRAYSPRK